MALGYVTGAGVSRRFLGTEMKSKKNFNGTLYFKVCWVFTVLRKWGGLIRAG